MVLELVNSGLKVVFPKVSLTGPLTVGLDVWAEIGRRGLETGQRGGELAQFDNLTSEP